MLLAHGLEANHAACKFADRWSGASGPCRRWRLTARLGAAYDPAMRLAFAALLLVPLVAHAADQTVLGSQLAVKNPSTADRRKVTVKAKEPGSDDTIVGNPVTTGASVTVTVGGGTPSSQTFGLPAGVSVLTAKPFWSGDAATGFDYRDAKGENGPVKRAQIRRAKVVFQIKIAIDARFGAVSIVPPNPGSDGCVLLAIGGGDSYSVQFASGQVTNVGALVFKVSRPSAEGSCVSTTTTTITTSTTTTTQPAVCGNGVIEPGEMCDGEPFCTSRCTVDLYACCDLPDSDMCTVGCTPIGMSCYLACGQNNPVLIGEKPVYTAPCPQFPDQPIGQGTCQGSSIAPTNVCCPLDAGGCTTTPATTTEELQTAVLDCVFMQGLGRVVVGSCVSGTCVPAH